MVRQDIMASPPVVIIGAGVSGLACALGLQQHGRPCIILEASNCAGGRIRTNVVDGFRLDLGFQVLLSAYPQTQRTLDYGELRLKSFYPGALVRLNGRFHTMSDPMRLPGPALATAFSPVVTLADKLRLLSLRRQVCSPSIPDLLKRPEVTTLERLRELGFSEHMINRFFRPFLGGIFLERELTTSSRKFEFLFRMFSLGQAALPAQGMQAIPQQMVNRLRPGVLRVGSRVSSIEEDGVRLENDEFIAAESVVIATAQKEANRLLRMGPSLQETSTTCLYYTAAKTPVRGPWLVLNGEATGPINHLCVLTEVQPSYGPGNVSLVSVTVLDGTLEANGSLEPLVRAQLREWYGADVREWNHLRTDRIAHALPLQAPPALNPVVKPVKLNQRLFVCGDHTTIASIEGAITSGQRAAQAVMEPA